MIEPTESQLDKVRKLIALANGASTDDERELALSKADAIMTKYAIDAAMLAVAKPAERVAPTSRRVKLYAWSEEFNKQFIRLVRSLEDHYRIRAVRHIDVVGEYTLIGYGADLDYFELVWTQVYLSFIARMEPSWDSNATEDSNVYRLKTAGIKWERIATLGGFDWPDGGRLKRAYRRECARLGEQPIPHTQRHAAYRLSYAAGFVARIVERTYRQEETRNATVSATPGAEVALRDRAAYVDDLLYQLFPALRPMTKEELERYNAAQAQRSAALQAKLDAMTPDERAKYEARQAREEAQWAKQYYKDQAAQARLRDYAGEAAGRTAADSVDLAVGKGINSRASGELN
jgi:hypothetical protein